MEQWGFYLMDNLGSNLNSDPKCVILGKYFPSLVFPHLNYKGLD